MFPSSREHLEAELRRLDLLIHREILRLRASYQLSLDEFRGLYVSDEQVDALVRRGSEADPGRPAAEELTLRAAEMRGRIDSTSNPQIPWRRVAGEFQLGPAEREALLIALAPEFDGKYETLYAYLNNDVARRWPTVDLVRRLSGGEGPLTPDNVLFASGLLQTFPSAAERSSWPAAGLRAAPVLAPYLMEKPILDPLLAEFCRVENPAAGWEGTELPPTMLAELRRAGGLFSSEAAPALVFIGRTGAERRRAAGAVCAEAGLSILWLDPSASSAWTRCGPVAALQARLHRCGIYIQNAESLFDREGNPLPESAAFVRTVAASGRPLILGIPPGLDWHDLLRDRPALPFFFPAPSYEGRLRQWRGQLHNRGFTPPDSELADLAGRFMLSPSQIAQAAALAAARHLLRGGGDEGPSLETLLEAARETSGRKLGRLAIKLEPAHDWNDLVLPAATLARVREVSDAIRNYSVVFEEWDFRRRIITGRGLKALFSGASGTGKTMTAAIIARELGLDIYRIDLSGIVSKYIGETEKNLDRIFQSAESGNAILFFDEADALFGRRSEVKDSHDRYANIEISYLLQKIEEYGGVVILASNMSHNIDGAFARRMNYVVEFPMPDEARRERLWRGMFPQRAPLGADVDFAFLARQFQLAGGEIRNVSLEAAFLAARDGRVIRMRHLVRAMARETLKQGKLPTAAEFKQHYALVGRE
ncbi:MAG: ATP-binding protein [Anaerolineales bacterium]|nr:ATP-binding protein [Anaerolineales bacterium]